MPSKPESIKPVFTRPIKILTALIISGVLLLVMAWQQLNTYMTTPLLIPAEGAEYTLAPGQTLNSLIYQLSADGLLRKPDWFKVYARLSGRGEAVKAGDYWLPQGLNPLQLLTKLEQGDVRYYQITLVEGWTLRQVRDAINTESKLQQTIQGDGLTAEQLDLSIEYTSLEGLLFPDTYRFHRATTDVQLLRQAYQQMQQVLLQEWENRAEGLPYQSAYEALIMASLVEKETGVASERAEIAGVFVRRLKKGMRLQTDPSTIYGLGTTFDGNLRTVHLKDSANLYNTYRHGGLPPTPIALAGREAIHAALHPADGEALYFVAKGDGSHYFSNTLEEHQKAVKKYQIYQRKKNYSSSPQKKQSG